MAGHLQLYHCDDDTGRLWQPLKAPFADLVLCCTSLALDIPTASSIREGAQDMYLSDVDFWWVQCSAVYNLYNPCLLLTKIPCTALHRALP